MEASQTEEDDGGRTERENGEKELESTLLAASSVIHYLESFRARQVRNNDGENASISAALDIKSERLNPPSEQEKESVRSLCTSYLSSVQDIEQRLIDAMSSADMKGNRYSQNGKEVLHSNDPTEPFSSMVLSLSQRIRMSSFAPPEYVSYQEKLKYRLPFPQEEQWNASRLKVYAGEEKRRETVVMKKVDATAQVQKSGETQDGEGGKKEEPRSSVSFQRDNKMQGKRVRDNVEDKLVVESGETGEGREGKAGKAPRVLDDLMLDLNPELNELDDDEIEFGGGKLSILDEDEDEDSDF